MIYQLVIVVLSILNTTQSLSFGCCRRKTIAAPKIERDPQTLKERQKEIRKIGVWCCGDPQENYLELRKQEILSWYGQEHAKILAALQKRPKKYKNELWPNRKRMIKQAIDADIHPDDIIFHYYESEKAYWTCSAKPLSKAVKENDLAFTQMLLQHKADPNQLGGNTSGPLLDDVTNPQMAQLLLAYKADAADSNRTKRRNHVFNGHLFRFPFLPLSPEVLLLLFQAGSSHISTCKKSPLWHYLRARYDITPELAALYIHLGSPLKDQPSKKKRYLKKFKETIKHTLIAQTIRNNPPVISFEAIEESAKKFLDALLKAEHEVAQARKNTHETGGISDGVLLHNKELIPLLTNYVEDHNIASLICNYAQNYVLPLTVYRQLQDITQKYPCEVAALPNYQPMKEDQEPKKWWQIIESSFMML